jgi:hypothetical protein
VHDSLCQQQAYLHNGAVPPLVNRSAGSTVPLLELPSGWQARLNLSLQQQQLLLLLLLL